MLNDIVYGCVWMPDSSTCEKGGLVQHPVRLCSASGSIFQQDCTEAAMLFPIISLRRQSLGSKYCDEGSAFRTVVTFFDGQMLGVLEKGCSDGVLYLTAASSSDVSYVFATCFGILFVCVFVELNIRVKARVGMILIRRRCFVGSNSW